MDTKKLPPALLMALGLASCGDDDSGTVSTGPCLDLPLMTETATSACLTPEPTAGSESEGSGSTTFGPCLDIPQGTTTGGESGSSSSGGETDTDTDGGTGTGTTGESEREDVVRSLLGRGILPDDVAAKLGSK